MQPFFNFHMIHQNVPGANVSIFFDDVDSNELVGFFISGIYLQ